MQYEDLVAAASKARGLAYAPYSKFAVGAALRTRTGKTFIGCNVENVSLGLTICAERSAVAAAIGGGSKDFEAIAIVTESTQPGVPCGACRQVLAEFNPTMRVLAATTNGKLQQLDLSELLPLPAQGVLEGTPHV